MSGIGGLLRFDGQQVSRLDLERMAAALRAYGPDQSTVMVSGIVGLVNVVMRMTPEDQFDAQPWRGSSGAIITADVRIDNRDDILARLGIAPQSARIWADSRILLMAWEKFGDSVWSMLHGPFAVAIWDEKHRVLTLARDQLGLNVITWHKTDHFFAFSSMPQGLFAIQDVPRTLNEEKIADFLVLNHSEHSTTVFRDIFRILPANLAKLKSNGTMSQTRYWSTADIKRIRFSTDDAYAEGLRECLDRAVRRQMRSAHPIGCYLSGGLDSSSVAALAAKALASQNQRLVAFTQVPRKGFDGKCPIGRYVDDEPYVEAIRKLAGNIDVTYIRNDQCDDFSDDLEAYFIALQGPVRNPTNIGWMLEILRRASAQGRRVLLGGAYGNYTISWSGWSQVVDHLLQGRLFTAYHEWRLFSRRFPGSRLAAFLTLFVEPLLPNWVENWDYRRLHPGNVAPWQDYSAIRPDFAVAMGVDARALKVGHDFLFRTRPGERMHSLHPVDYGGDLLAADKAYAKVEVRDPTADMEVVSYCFGVPPEQYLCEGIDRSLVRRAMWGLLPKSVLGNWRKGLQSADWYEKLERRRDKLATDISELSSSRLARRAIDLERLDKAVRNWPTGGWHTRQTSVEYEMALPRGVAVGRFIRWAESNNSMN
jgi:asparagine synthase (glutamine-hydrolysing)